MLIECHTFTEIVFMPEGVFWNTKRSAYRANSVTTSLRTLARRWPRRQSKAAEKQTSLSESLLVWFRVQVAGVDRFDDAIDSTPDKSVTVEPLAVRIG